MTSIDWNYSVFFDQCNMCECVSQKRMGPASGMATPECDLHISNIIKPYSCLGNLGIKVWCPFEEGGVPKAGQSHMSENGVQDPHLWKLLCSFWGQLETWLSNCVQRWRRRWQSRSQRRMPNGKCISGFGCWVLAVVRRATWQPSLSPENLKSHWKGFDTTWVESTYTTYILLYI